MSGTRLGAQGGEVALPYISPISRLHLAYISPMYHLGAQGGEVALQLLVGLLARPPG